MRILQDVCQTEDGKITVMTDPEARIMLHCEGAELRDDYAKELGIVGDPRFDPEAKAIKSVPEDKALKPKESKAK